MQTGRMEAFTDGFVLLMAAGGFLWLQRRIVKVNGEGSMLSRAVGHDAKGKWSLALYLVALAVVAWLPWLSCVLYAVVAAIWIVPDRRMERVFS